MSVLTVMGEKQKSSIQNREFSDHKAKNTR